jgi:hypothetical protein
MEQALKGGKADKLSPRDFPQKALKKGQKHEREHTKNKGIATEIAMDHLSEDPQYYEKIERIEKKGFALGFAKIVALLF